REDQVSTAAVDVDRVAEGLTDHRRALDVPAGSAVAPGAGQERLAGLGPLPEREVSGIFLTGLQLHADAGQLAFFGAPGQLPVRLELVDFEVDVAVRLIGEGAF